LAQVLLARIVAIWGPASVHDRLAATEELLELATSLEDPVLVCPGCWHRFVAAMEAGEVAIADRCLDKADQLAEDLGQPTMRWLTMILRANRLLSVGLLKESEHVAAQAFELGRSAGHPDAFLYYGIHVFNVRFDSGNLSEIADDVIRIADANPGVLSIRATLGLLYSEIGELEKARTAFESVVEALDDVPQEASWPRAVTQAAMTCARLQDRERAAVLLELLTPYSGQMVCTGLSWAGSFDHYIGILVAVLGRLDEADAKLAEAELAHARVPAPAWLARSRLERARVLLSRRAAGDLERAGDLLNEVVGAAREYELGAVERSAAGLLRKMSSWS
jgi:tetratricopeptide (TPR) repeat protein